MPEPPPTDLEPWRPHREPSPAELVLAGVRGAARTTAELVERTMNAFLRPASSVSMMRS